jgi:3-oxoadipate enol-lactonase
MLRTSHFRHDPAKNRMTPRTPGATFTPDRSDTAKPGPMPFADGTHYMLHGPDAAPPVLLIHGLGLRQEMWQWTLPALAPAYRVITYDLEGHGKSAPPTGQPTLADLARQAAQLLDHLGIARLPVVGFSLGGMVARRLAMNHPDRVSALAILNSAHRRTPAQQQAVESRLAQVIAEGPAATVEAAVARWFTDAFRARDTHVTGLVRQWVTANDHHVYSRLYRILAEGVEELVAPQPPIACPTLVLTAEDDVGNTPEMSRRIASDIAGAECLILPRLRHMALAEDPAAVNAPLLAFLNRVSA